LGEEEGYWRESRLFGGGRGGITKAGGEREKRKMRKMHEAARG
jgi:hypothetical protein